MTVFLAVDVGAQMRNEAVLLNAGQSAISRSIAELERVVGVPLLECNLGASSQSNAAGPCSMVERLCSMICAKR